MAKTSHFLRGTFLLVLTLIPSLGIGIQITYAGTYQYTIEAGPYQIVSVGDGYREIHMEGFGQLLAPGKPKLPSRIFAIAIPPGVTADSVEIVGNGRVEFSGTYPITPAPMAGGSDAEREENDSIRAEYDQMVAQAYASDAPYPDTEGKFIIQGAYRKYNLVQVRFTPFQYKAKSGRLFYYPSATVTVNYSLRPTMSYQEGVDTRAPDLIGDRLPELEKRASEILLNYDEAQGWFPAPVGEDIEDAAGLYEFVIVTTDALVDAVQPLVNWEKCKGKTVYVATTSWIDAHYSGADLARRIRYFLHYNYPSTEWGITDVCLVGDLNDVPMRYCHGEGPTGSAVPTDLYYAELSLIDSASWDLDWDGIFGEQADDAIDFVNEINVARIPWSDPATVESICQKMAAFEYSTDMNYKLNYLLTGAFSRMDTDNAVLKNYIIDHELDPEFPPIRIYEQGPCWDSAYYSEYGLSRTITREVWGNDYGDGPFGFVNLSGHGNAFSVFYKERHDTCDPEAYFSADDCSYLDDTHPAIVFSNACSTGYPEDDNSLGRRLIKEGAVAFVGGTRGVTYAYAWQDPSDGWSQTLDWLFTHHAVSYNAIRYSVGESHQLGLRAMYFSYGWDEYWKHIFVWNIYGNPDLRLADRPSSLPNLDYLYRYGWDYPIVPRSAGYATGSLCPLTSTLPGNTMVTYFNFTWENNGSIDAPQHRTRLYVDEKPLFTSQPTLGAGSSIYHTNIQSASVTVQGGRHTLYYDIDEDSQVWEGDESDNWWGHQFVWSPYYLESDTPTSRGAPPDHNAWAAPYWFNCDGFYFVVNTAPPNKWWSAVGILPYNAAADYDLRLWDRGDYTGSLQGFGGGYLVSSVSGPGASDFVIVNNNTAPSGTYYTGVINSNDETGNYHIEEATSIRIETGTNGPYTMSSTAVLDIYEYYMYAGDYGIKLEQTAGTCDLGMSLYDDETAYCRKSDYMAGAYVNSGWDGDNEYMQVSIPDSGYHGLVIWKADAGDYPKTSTYNIKVAPCGTPGTPAHPYPADGAENVSVDADLNWNDCADTEYYEVWLREGTGSWVKLGETETSAWTQPPLNEGTFYQWHVLARNICGGYAEAYWEFTTEGDYAPPVIDAINFEGCISELCTAAISVTAHDPTGGTLTYDYNPLDGGTIDGSGFGVSFNPPDSGPHPCPYQVELAVTSLLSGLSTNIVIDITVKLAGDVDGSGSVNALDRIYVRNAFGSVPGDPNWDPGADVDCSGSVNALDRIYVRNQFGCAGCACP